MTEVKPTIVSQIRAFKEANPNASIKEIAAACNTSKPYVYQVLFPKGKKKVDAPKVEATSSKDQDKLIATLRKELADYQTNEEKFEAAFTKVMVQIVEACAVIKYLEQKLKKDAAPV